MAAIVAALLLIASISPPPVPVSCGTAGSFRAGLCFSQTRPLTPKEQAALLKGLRRLTGFTEVRSDVDGFVLLGDRTRLAGGSAAARTLLCAVVDGLDSYTIEGHGRSAEIAFARIQSRVDYVNPRIGPLLTRHSWGVEIDFQDYNELRGQAEAIAAFDPALSLLHELAHGVLKLRDAPRQSDPIGDCERYINQIRRELGLPERESYEPTNTQAVTPFGTEQRLLAELTFVRADPGKRVKRIRLTFDVENVSAAAH